MGYSVKKLRKRISQAEWVEWKVFYGRRAQREELEAKKAKRKKGRR